MPDKTFNLMTQLSLNSADFKAGIDKVKGNVKDLMLGVEDATGNVGEMKKALMSLRNISFAGKSVEEIQAINQQIGTLTNEMSNLKASQKAMGEAGIIVFGKLTQAATMLGEVGVGLATVFGADSKQTEELRKNRKITGNE